jgi:hypothetical protein
MRHGIDLGHGILGKSTGGLGLALSSVLQACGWAPQEAQIPGQINPSSLAKDRKKEASYRSTLQGLSKLTQLHWLLVLEAGFQASGGFHFFQQEEVMRGEREEMTQCMHI